MYTLTILPTAVQDLKEAYEWYSYQQKELGHLFLNRIREKGDFIQSFPFAFPERFKDVRVAKVSQFPFLIHYHISDSKNTVTVFAILHTSRNPQAWKRRMNW